MSPVHRRGVAACGTAAQHSEPHTVYLYRDADGSPLYVGCTCNWPKRDRDHRRAAPWRDDVATVEVVANGMARFDALDLERDLIQQLRPVHNVAGTPEWLEAIRERGRALARRNREASA